MATLTAGGVFRLAKRFVEASRGTTVRLTSPFICISAGPVRFTHGPCGVQKLKQTAESIDRPPDRRTNDLILATIRMTDLEFREICEPRTNAMREPDKLDLTAGEPPHRTEIRTEHGTREAGETIQTTRDADEARRTNAPATPPAHERNPPHRSMETNRCKNKPPTPLWTQSKRLQAPGSPSSEATVNPSEKATPPPEDSVPAKRPNPQHKVPHENVRQTNRCKDKPPPPPLDTERTPSSNRKPTPRSDS